MKRIFLISILLMTVASSSFAAPRTKAQAKAIAEKMAEKIGSIVYDDAVAVKRAPVRKVGAEETAAYYIFDYGNNEGFIIVSGDDRMPEIVGYSDQGAFSEEDMPEPLKEFLEAYTRTVTAVAEGDAIATENASQASAATSVTPVAPLLGTISWNQDAPYNLMCPLISGKSPVTGCAATAISMIMRYHKYPVNQVALEGYTTETNYISIPSIAASTATEDQFDWDNMLPVYTSAATEQQQNAVAKLMYHVGVALKMDYGVKESSAYNRNMLPAFKTFGYDESLLQSVERKNYTYTEWKNIILRELNAKRPISYNGQSSGGGHAFVCDGIDSDGFVHINWGWGGSSNGYFDVAVLNPNDNSGIGASTTTDGYYGSNMMVIGITPANTAGESKVPAGTYSSDWTKLSMSIVANDDNKLYYNTSYTYKNKLIVTVTNSGDKDFYNWSELRFATTETMPSTSKKEFPNLYMSLQPGETKTYVMDITVSKSGESYPENMSYWFMMNNGSTVVMDKTTFPVLEIGNPNLTITSITANTSGTHEVTYAGYNVMAPSVKDSYITYTVTVNNTGSTYRGNDIYFGFYNPATENFTGSAKSVEFPNGTSTYSITDKSLVYGQMAGLVLWTPFISGILNESETQKLYVASGGGYLSLKNRLMCYAEGPTYQVTIRDANYSANDNCYYSTLYLDYAVKIPEGVKAYTAEIKSGTEIVITPIDEDVIPAYTGVVLEMSSTGTYDFHATSTDAAIGSDLQGILTSTPTSSVSGSVYVLNIKEGSPLFSRYTGANLGANKAYLVFPSSEAKYTLRMADDDVTAIKSATATQQGDSRYYNLQGVPVSNPSKGIYIKNGKKIIIK